MRKNSVKDKVISSGAYWQAKAQSRTQAVPCEHEGKLLYYYEDNRALEQAAKRDWAVFFSKDIQKPTWMLSCANYCRKPASAVGWTRWSQEVHSILWCHPYTTVAVCWRALQTQKCCGHPDALPGDPLSSVPASSRWGPDETANPLHGDDGEKYPLSTGLQTSHHPWLTNDSRKTRKHEGTFYSTCHSGGYKWWGGYTLKVHQAFQQVCSETEMSATVPEWW